MSGRKIRQKPVGTTGPIELGPEGAIRHHVVFPKTKDEIELFIAKGFCHRGGSSYLPHFKRYSDFHNLRQQHENSIDFKWALGLENAG